MASSKTSSSIKQYLQSRKAAVGLKSYLNQLYASNPYSSNKPHSCVHCRPIVIDIGDDGRTTRLCYEIRKAVAAAEDGCQLFQLFIDLSVKGKLDDDFCVRGNIIISAKYEKERLPNSLAQVLFSAHSREDSDDDRDVLDTHGLTVWVKDGGPALTDICARPYNLEYGSAEAIRFAQDCVTTCQRDHRECRGVFGQGADGHVGEMINPSSLPFRLLELYVNDSILYFRLIGQHTSNPIDQAFVSNRGYAILSYCWGGDQPLQLTGSSVGLLEAGMPVSSLPKTIRDTAWFTHAMGLEYLWVDALCILQDDTQNKGLEISRMALYYSQSTVTICAASPAKYSEGFLHTRVEDPTDYKIGPIQVQVLTSSGLPGSVQLFNETDYFNTQRPPEPITLRAWTLQEALLSRRILIFSTRHLYFTCNVANASCGGQEPTLKARMMPSYQSPVPGVHTFAGFERYPIVGAWNIVITEYTSRYLGFAADKLPAISALAASLVDLAGKRQQKLSYLAGLMFDETDPEQYSWRMQLLWATDQTQAMRKIPGRAPSWAWSTLDGPIMGWRLPRPQHWTMSDGIRLLQYHVDLEDESLPFGAVSGGLLRIWARTRELGVIPGIEFMLLTSREYVRRKVDSEGTVLALRPDTKEAEKMANQALQGSHRVLLLELIPFYIDSVSPTGLMITQEDNVKDEVRYVRIGIFEFKGPDRGETTAELHARETFFDGSPFREVSIV
ncbi:HET-domain-containing protein [Daldinia sp. FL1419]|nr:HET-domain-containing protein [Daldinia sp. FL1419]